jgi:hypothetical protein
VCSFFLVTSTDDGFFSDDPAKRATAIVQAVCSSLLILGGALPKS